ncbi:MAG TPA: hypothetical protein VMM18_10345 [Gemmatimonadaceae bacterium]|nr:hypothetical protein [Gemmatimonadaceae bacterium]
MTRARVVATFVAASLLAGALPAGAQQRLTGLRTVSASPTFETWSFGARLFQPAFEGGDSLELRGASQWSVPVTVAIPLGDRWRFDVAAAYASGRVSLRAGSARSLSLSGMSDTKLRLTRQFGGDNVLLTLGVNAPTGKTSLDDEELAALRVLGAPALAHQLPTLGSGFGGTAGIVFARPIGAWGWAAGVSYEMRGSYTPLADAGGIPAPDFSPSDVIHLSLGTSGLIGQNEMMLAFSADLFDEDRLRLDGDPGGGARTRLGPVLTAEWELRLAARGFRELTLSIVDRYRMPYERGGERVAESSGNYLDAGVRGSIPMSPATSLVVGVGARHHTGLGSDDALASASLAAGVLRLALARDLAGGYLLQPFATAQFGTIESGQYSASARGIAAGVTIGRRF